MNFFKCRRPYDRIIDDIMGKGIVRVGPWAGSTGPCLAHILKAKLPPETIHVKRMGWNDYVFARTGKRFRRLDTFRKHTLYQY